MGLFTKKTKANQLLLSIPEMSCAHCEAAVTKALSPLQGVKKVNVNLKNKTVTLETEQTEAPSLQEIQSALEDTSYTASLKK